MFSSLRNRSIRLPPARRPNVWAPLQVHRVVNYEDCHVQAMMTPDDQSRFRSAKRGSSMQSAVLMK